MNNQKSLLEVLSYLAVGAILSYFFATPLKSYFTELVRPTIEWVLGERETKSHSVHWNVEPD